MAKNIEVAILGNPAGLLRAYRDSEKGTKEFGKKLDGAFGGIKNQLMGLGASVGAAFAFKDIITSTMDLAGETKKLQRVTGGTAEDMSTLVAIGKRYGLTADDLSRSIGILSKDVANGGDKLAKWGINAFDAEGKARPFKDILADIAEKAKTAGPGFDTTTMSMELFGKSGKDLLPILLAGGDGINALADKAQEAGVVLGQDDVDAAAAMKGSLKDLTEKFDGLKIKIGTEVIPILSSMADFINGHFTEVLVAVGILTGTIAANMAIGWAKSVADSIVEIEKLLVKLGILGSTKVAAGTIETAAEGGAGGVAKKGVGPAIGGAIGGAMAGVGGAAMAGLGAIATALGVSVAAAAGIVVAAVVVIAGAIYLVIRYWDEIVAAGKVAGQAISDAFWAVVGVFGSLPDIVGGAVSAVGSWFGQLPGVIGGALSGALSSAGTFASNLLSTLGTGASNAVSAVGNFFAGLPGVLAYHFGQALGIAVFWPVYVTQAIQAGLAALGPVISNAFWAVVNTIGSILSQAPGVASNAFWAVVNAIGNAIAALPGQVSNVFWSVVNTIGSALSQAPGIASNAFWGVVNAATGGMSNMVSAIASGIGNALQWFRDMPGNISGAIGDLGGLLWQKGRDIVQGLLNGLGSMGDALWDFAAGIGGQIWDGFTSVIPSLSPAPRFIQKGIDIGEGLLVGMGNRLPAIADAARAMASSVIQPFGSGMQPAFASSGGNRWQQGDSNRWQQSGGVTFQSGAIVVNGASNPDATADAVYHKIMDKLERNVSRY